MRDVHQVAAGLLVVTMALSGSALVGQTWDRDWRARASDFAIGDSFGSEVLVSGEFAFLQGPDADGFNGAVYVYQMQPDGSWIQTERIAAPESTSDFGHSMGIDGDTLVLGSSDFFSAGAAYVYELQADDSWDFVQTLTASDGDENDFFGHAVALSGDWLVVGAFDDDVVGFGTGSAYFFERDQSGFWLEMQKVNGSDAGPGDSFGEVVQLEGDLAIIAAPRIGSSEGGAYVFERDHFGVWQETQILTVADEVNGDRVGESMSLSGDHLALGAPLLNTEEFDSGAVFTFTRDGSGVWTENQRLELAPVKDEQFGLSVDLLADDTLVVGAAGLAPGSIHIYEYDEALGWQPTEVVQGPGSRHLFGAAVSLESGAIVVGSPNAFDGGPNADYGRVFALERAE